jgi:ribosomal-protein-alanine N-acetyltransferase
MVGNERSERVLERARFTREGRLRAYRMCRGRPRDYWVFRILRTEWEQMPQG